MTSLLGMADLDREVQKLHDDYWEDQKRFADRKTVLLVEGDDDRDILETFLERRLPTFSTRVRVIPAGGRSRVLRRLELTFPQNAHPNAYGFVDRDTWTDQDVVALKSADPRLFVTKGWCLENAFFLPDSLGRCNAAVRQRITAERERWVLAGALWWALQRMREAQQMWQEALEWSYGSPRADLDLRSANTLAESLKRKIPEAMRRSASVDVDAAAEAFTARCTEVLALPEDEQWQTGVHGKCALRDLLAPAQGVTPAALRQDLAEQIERPAPIDELIAILLP